MRRFLIIDIYNLFFRGLHTINVNDSEELQNGMLLHMMFNMMKKACEKFKPQHLVICTDGHKSWRKNVYYAYKANRLERLQERSPFDALREDRLKEIFTSSLLPFLKDNTNATFLGCDYAEADDLVARFIKKHSNDICIIMSTDNDYVQLLNDNVVLYNSMEGRIITNKCIVTDDDKKTPLKFGIKDGKIMISKTDNVVQTADDLIPMKDWVEYALFSKCIRGDKSDNIISAFPRVREASTKKQIGMLDAFNDRKEKGYNWQSFMNSTWTNPLGEKKLVKECYEFNKKIIDLNEIPDELCQKIDNTIDEEINREKKASVGFYLTKYLKKWKLERMLQNIQVLSEYFDSPYPKE